MKKECGVMDYVSTPERFSVNSSASTSAMATTYLDRLNVEASSGMTICMTSSFGDDSVGSDPSSILEESGVSSFFFNGDSASYTKVLWPLESSLGKKILP